VFDKTGTLTTGNFVVKQFHSDIAEDEFKQIVYSLEKFSTHPIAASLAAKWKTSIPILWKNIAEIKGVGMQATDMQGNVFTAGAEAVLAKNNNGEQHSVYVTKNAVLIGWIDLEDEVRPEAAQVVTWLKAQGIHTILLSGDSEKNCKTIGAAVGITDILWRHTPAQKLEKLSELNAIKPTAMVGDGINDAPALAKATVGISLSEASQLAMQSADVILLSNGLTKLPTALGLGKHTYLTIQQNLFWAFAYNIVAIPAAAFGFLTPSLSALSMGFSDVILGINSVRLFVKKVI
jgi:Cu+-exporting ATPase